ncbi:hypothetical protein [Actinomadura sp. CNU-125]|uniref:hypothetical protein n=1 Tax=Actinomadura sp. CNU-125 TaxID=1904961 RepID=UPI003966EEFA
MRPAHPARRGGRARPGGVPGAAVRVRGAQAIERHDLDTVEGRLAALDAAAPVVAAIKDRSRRHMYAINLDRWLGIMDEQFVLRRVRELAARRHGNGGQNGRGGPNGRGGDRAAGTRTPGTAAAPTAAGTAPVRTAARTAARTAGRRRPGGPRRPLVRPSTRTIPRCSGSASCSNWPCSARRCSGRASTRRSCPRRSSRRSTPPSAP